MTQSHSRSSDASDPGDFLTGLAWDLVVLSVSVVAFLWSWATGVTDGIVLVIGIVVALAAARTVSRVVEHNRSSGN